MEDRSCRKAASRTLGQFFKPNGPDWTLRQRPALCALQVKPSRHQIKQEFS